MIIVRVKLILLNIFLGGQKKYTQKYTHFKSVGWFFWFSKKLFYFFI